MKRRIAVGGILTECNHLGGLPITLQDYEDYELLRGDELLGARTSVVGGMLSTLAARQADVAPLLYASMCSAGAITSDCYRKLSGELLDRLAAQVDSIDAVLMPLHGSALVEDVDDPEGDMLCRVRSLVGPDRPVIATLDLHAHVTAEMVKYADALLAWETYPHCDQFQTGQRGASLLLDTLEGKCRPTMVMGKAPVITSAINASTQGDDPFAELMRHTKALEQREGVLSTSLFLIHPYMDVPGMGSGGLVITNNDRDLAVSLAGEIGRMYWERRHDLEPTMWTPADAILAGKQVDGGPVILVEASDCCGGGAAGDSIATLSALVDNQVEEVALTPVVDPEAAALCHLAGEGASLALSLGHKLDRRWGQPREFSGRVEQLSEGRFVYTGGQWEGMDAEMGPSAVFAIGALRVLITTKATYDWSDEQFRSVGMDPAQAKFIVAKNPMNYRQAYGSFAKRTFVLDTPGPTPATLRHIDFQKLARPYFPADSEIPDFAPVILG